MPLPVLATVQTTFVLVATHILTFLRLSWLAMLIAALASTAVGLKLLPLLAALKSNDPQQIAAALSPTFGWLLTGVAVPIAMSAVAGVAVLRFVVMGEVGSRGSPVHVSFGWREMRVIGVTLLIAALLFLISALLSVILGVVMSSAGAPAFEIAGSGAIVLALMIIGTRWLMAYPVAAIEDRINFERAWALIKPCYGRFLLVMLMLCLPLFVLDLAMSLVFAPPPSDDVVVMERAIEGRWIVLTASGFLINFVVTSVFFTGLGVVYRARIKGQPAPRPEAASRRA